MRNEKPIVGIVVIGRNEGQRLLQCFDSLKGVVSQVVYVDSQSSDDSVEEAKKRRIETIVLDASSPMSAARARNEGFDRLIKLYPSIDYVHFIDGDCELDAKWLTISLSEFARHEKVAVICGRLREKYRDTNIYMKLCDMDWYRPPGLVKSCGGIATYRRSVFEEQSGFNASLISGEEPEFCSRIRGSGWEILCINAEMGTHDSAMTRFSQWWTRSVKVGYGFMSGSEWGGWSKQYKSSLFWGGGLPTFVILIMLFSIKMSVILLAYPIQTYRVFSKVQGDNLTNKERSLYAFFCILAKFPETQGILTYYISRVLKKNQIIQYK